MDSYDTTEKTERKDVADFAALNKLSRHLAACKDSERLHVMAQNPSGNYYWTKSLGEVTAADMRSVVNIAIAAMMALESERSRIE